MRVLRCHLTDIDNKDTGDYAGDIAFTLMELAMPMKCRHEPTNKDCQCTLYRFYARMRHIYFLLSRVQQSAGSAYIPTKCGFRIHPNNVCPQTNRSQRKLTSNLIDIAFQANRPTGG